MAKANKGPTAQGKGKVANIIALPIPAGAGRQMPAPMPDASGSPMPAPYTAHRGGPLPGDGEARGVVGMHKPATLTPHGLPHQEPPRAMGKIADRQVPGTRKGK